MGSINNRENMRKEELARAEQVANCPVDKTYPAQKAKLNDRWRNLAMDTLGKKSEVPQEKLQEQQDENIAADAKMMLSELKKIMNAPYIRVENKKIWFSRICSLVFPSLEALPKNKLRQLRPALTPEFTSFTWEGLNFDANMTLDECRKLFTKNKGAFSPYPQMNINNQILVKGFVIGSSKNGAYPCVMKTGRTSYIPKTDAGILRFPVLRQGVRNDLSPMFWGQAVIIFLYHGWLPRGLSPKAKATYQKLSAVQQNRTALFQIQGDELLFNEKAWQKLQREDRQQRKAAKPVDLAEERQLLETSLLNCDYWRANIQPYDRSTLTDINGGHWELAESEGEGTEVDLPENTYFARPPQLDVVDNATCAIDFGTKSTVVVCRKDNHEALLRIGKGNYLAKPTQADYENPTVIALKDFQSFMAAYHERIGRPFTEWNQVMVSHQALGILTDLDGVSDSSVYYSVFNELKQWANDKDGQINLRDQKGKLIDLKPYVELQEGDFDPIELYAYYLGLNINNMHQKICLDYLMTYPVTYSKEVRERIRQSFERGLKKSLPPALLHDEERMKHFRVALGANEAVAYALSALRVNHLEPSEKNQSVAFAVFDFGGGTTDYDFGIETYKGGRRKYEVEEYDSGGDPYLGGENLLHLLAYEVYKQNLDVMREHKISLVLPPKENKVAGTESLVFTEAEATQIARMNMTILVEKLRPFWEREDSDQTDKPFFEQSLSVKLYRQADDEESTTVELKVVEQSLNDCLHRRIQEGVDNFFAQLRTAFFGKQEFTLPIHIFMAGNSCKSKLVQKIITDGLQAEETEYQQILAAANGEQKNAGNAFELHFPLTGEDDKDLSVDQRRTGKTGVAFGLLRTRIGARDVLIKSKEKEAKFRFYLGTNDDGYFVVHGENADYGTWFEFEWADQPEFFIYYTEEAKVADGKASIRETKEMRCYLDEDEVQGDETADEVKIFMRKKGPDVIEYAVGRAEDFAGDFKGKTHTLQLK